MANSKPARTKLKTHKSAAARFSTTGSGKLMRTKGPKGHMRRKKRGDLKSQLDEMVPVNSSQRRHVQRMIPYGA